MLPLAILATVLATSVLSGILGMAGGMLLMAVLVSLLPVSGAMVLHGAVQAMANGSDYLVIGRSVTAADDPLAALERVHRELGRH